MNKIDAINALEVVDWSAAFGELEYVLAANNEENRRILLDGGFTEEEIQESCNEPDIEFDLSYLAFNYAGAKSWNKDSGFSKEEVNHE